MRTSKTDSAAVELHFLVAPAQVEAARLAMAPFCLEETPRANAGTPANETSPRGRRFSGLTLGELKLLLRD
ncbi:hypothetical protein JCM15519_06200 [Fundidesulfovibrio butyratiphilus]